MAVLLTMQVSCNTGVNTFLTVIIDAITNHNLIMFYPCN